MPDSWSNNNVQSTRVLVSLKKYAMRRIMKRKEIREFFSLKMTTEDNWGGGKWQRSLQGKFFEDGSQNGEEHSTFSGLTK